MLYASRVDEEVAIDEMESRLVERMSLGQVTEYTVFRVEGEERTFLGTGTKREAQRIFDKQRGFETTFV